MTNWYEIDTRYDFQYELYENESTGEVLAIEMQEEPWHADIEPPDISVRILPPDFSKNPDPVKVLLDKTKSLDEAIAKAREHMNRDAEPAQ